MATHLRTELVVDALRMALWGGKPQAGLIHHPDRGVFGTPLFVLRQAMRQGSSPRWEKGVRLRTQRACRILRGKA
jgi:hypothetical protein